jgi:AraC family transcriptional regulator
VYAETVTINRASQAAGRWLAPGVPGRHTRQPVLFREQLWRQSCDGAPSVSTANIRASRWTDERTTARQERSDGAPDRYVIAVALRPVRMRLGREGGIVFEGTMPTGMVHVTEPGQIVEAEFFTPCDFIHFHVAAGYLRNRQAAAGAALLRDGAGSAGERSLRDLMVRDDLAAQLSRSLTEDLDGGDPLYAESVGQTVLMRLLALPPPASRVGALAKWRLRRVQQHLTANIAEPISLADLADAAGLSRMHFAAQFRVATGCRPHDYLLQQRIECAKQLLAGTATPLVEVALSVGFQTQSHFSTVFKRLAGDTPARWQRTQRAA